MAAQSGIEYVRTSDDIDLAYTTYGDGPRDLVLIHGFTTHLDFVRDCPWHWMWTQRLGEHFRVIELDKRGTGLSDRSLGHGSLEDRTRDVLAVMDAAGSTRASIVGISEGGPMALSLAAMYPERVDRIVLYGSMARIAWAPDYPEGVADEMAEVFLSWMETAWGSGEVFATFLITHAPDIDAAIRFMAKFERNACTRRMAMEIMRRNLEIDIRRLLPSVSVPTLVIHNTGDPLIPVSIGRYLGEHIPGARYVEGDGDYHCTWAVDEFEPLLEQAIGFLQNEATAPERHPAPDSVRSLATILFTDIVDSTDKAAALGDERWSQLLDQHNRRGAEAVRRRAGTVVKTTGDGMLALFDGPSRAIQAVHELRRDVRDLGLQLRAGIHTGEIERTNGDVAGIGVHIAARVMALAGPDEILASRTVRELSAGSGVNFSERGTHTLRGVPGEWDIYAVADAAGPSQPI